MKVFDSKVELSESEEETETAYSTSVMLDGEGTKIMILG